MSFIEDQNRAARLRGTLRPIETNADRDRRAAEARAAAAAALAKLDRRDPIALQAAIERHPAGKALPYKLVRRSLLADAFDAAVVGALRLALRVIGLVRR